jgi:hypothetical protein
MVYDFSLDPLSVKQVFSGVHEAAIGRWSWFPQAGDPQIFGIPVFNFTGWVLLCGLGTAFLLLGRYLYKKSGYKAWVGYLYPPVAMILAMIALVCPLSSFLLWLAPFSARGSSSQWVMLALYFALQLVVYLFIWRGRMRTPLTFKDNWPIFYVLVGSHLINIAFTLIGGYYSILWLQALTLAVGLLMLLPVYRAGLRLKQAA